jgi:hypothetical protein
MESRAIIPVRGIHPHAPRDIPGTMPEAPDPSTLPSALIDAALWAQAFASCALAGLIWFVQVVHYPLLRQVGPDTFAAYHAAHTRRTTLVVAPLMLAEAIAALALVVASPGSATARTGLVLVALLWASTFFVQVPIHNRLARGPHPADLTRLVRTNTLRTSLWTLRAVLALWMLPPA